MRSRTQVLFFALALALLSGIPPAHCQEEIRYNVSISVPAGYMIAFNGVDVKMRSFVGEAVFAEPEDGLFKRVELLTSDGRKVSDDTFSAYFCLEREGEPEGVRATAGIRLDGSKDGVRIRNVLPMSPADEAGMKSGQWIVQVNGESVTNIGAAVTKIRGLELGKEAKITVLTGDKESGKLSILTMIPRAMYGTGAVKLGRLIPSGCNFKAGAEVNCLISLDDVTKGTPQYWHTTKAEQPALTVTFNMNWTPRVGLQVRLSGLRGVRAWDGAEKSRDGSVSAPGIARYTDLPSMFELRTCRGR